MLGERLVHGVVHPLVVKGWRLRRRDDVCRISSLHCALVEGLALGDDGAVSTPTLGGSHDGIGAVRVCWVV